MPFSYHTPRTQRGCTLLGAHRSPAGTAEELPGPTRTPQPKVFGVGLSRTGTRSLCDALRHLGYSTKHNPLTVVDASWYDAAADITVSWRFPLLAYLFPDARFIYTRRTDTAAWLRSCEQHWREVVEPGWDIDAQACRRYDLYAHREAVVAIYGQHRFEAATWEAAYQEHEERVLATFAHHPHRLLCLEVAGDTLTDACKWKSLCGFLGHPVPSAPFPHQHRTAGGTAC